MTFRKLRPALEKVESLFPDGYNDGTGPGPTAGSKFFGVGTIIGFSVPVILFALLFGIYRFVLSNVGENLIQAIK